MHETQSDKRPPNVTPQSPPPMKDHILVKHLYFADNIDLCEGRAGSQVSNLKCYPFPEASTRYCTCVFFPELQAFEITYYAGPKVEPEKEMIPQLHVRRWKRG